MTKLTKVQVLEMLAKEVVVSENEVYSQFVAHEIELLNKKSASKKPTKTQKANEELKSKLVTTLSEVGKPMSIKDLQSNGYGEFTSQKLSPLLNKLVESGKVVKTYDKKTPLFSISQ